MHAHVFRHCSGSQIHPNSLPARTETFLRVAPRACVVKKYSQASWPAKCHFSIDTTWVYLRQHTTLTRNCKHTFSAIVQQAKSSQIRSRRKGKLLCAWHRARVLKKTGPASWPAKCHFGTIWVYRREHTSLTQNCKRTFSAIVQQAKSSQIRSRRKGKLLCAWHRARVLKKTGPASWPAKCHFGTIWVYRREHTSLTQNCKRTFSAILQQAAFP